MPVYELDEINAGNLEAGFGNSIRPAVAGYWGDTAKTQVTNSVRARDRANHLNKRIGPVYNKGKKR